MKKIKVEVETTLTYRPFENINELLKSNDKDKKVKKEKAHEK